MSEKRAEVSPQERVVLKEKKRKTKPIWVPSEAVVYTDPHPWIRSREFMGEIGELVGTEEKEIKLRWQDSRNVLGNKCFCVIWEDNEGRERFGWITRVEDGVFLGPGGKELKVKERPKKPRKKRPPEGQYELPLISEEK